MFNDPLNSDFLSTKARWMTILRKTHSFHIIGLIGNPMGANWTDNHWYMNQPHTTPEKRLIMEYCELGDIHGLLERRIVS